MTERKPITGDLRRWWELHCRALATPELDEGLDALCGAIDAVHANLEGENESLRRELDRALGEWDYWESTHVELPKDADGEVIHVGDAMERGVEWMPVAWNPKRETFYHTSNGVGFCADQYADGVKIYTDATITPEQAIAATLGAGTCRKVYLVETSDDLIESWCPLSVYLHREAAEDCAEALRKEEDGIRQFARVSELKVVDDG